MKKLLFIYIIIISFACEKDKAEMPDNSSNMSRGDTLSYMVTINYHFNDSLFANNYPNDAHFSQIIGWSHNNTSDIFTIGQLASNGIKSMSETGSTSTLNNEINALIKNGNGHHLHIGSGLSTGEGSISFEFEVCKTNSYVTLVSMIAPSPDWFVAFKAVNLLENNMFIDEITLNGYLYDAGTDSGINYNSSNLVTIPQENIYKITGEPIFTSENQEEIIASIHFRKI